MRAALDAVYFIDADHGNIVPALFAGCILQGISGSATWIVGSATMTDHVEVENLGKLYGLSMSFVSAGVGAGPAIAGTILELAGYWPAWSIPLGLLVLDIIMRGIMIEGPKPSSNYRNPATIDSLGTTVSNRETSARPVDHIFTNRPSNSSSITETHHEVTLKPGFYKIMMSDARVIAGLSNTILSVSLLASFDATLMHPFSACKCNVQSQGACIPLIPPIPPIQSARASIIYLLLIHL